MRRKNRKGSGIGKRAEIRLKEAELKQAEKASQASKNPLRERRFVVQY